VAGGRRSPSVAARDDDDDVGVDNAGAMDGEREIEDLVLLRDERVLWRGRPRPPSLGPILFDSVLGFVFLGSIGLLAALGGITATVEALRTKSFSSPRVAGVGFLSLCALAFAAVFAKWLLAQARRRRLARAEVYLVTTRRVLRVGDPDRESIVELEHVTATRLAYPSIEVLRDDGRPPVVFADLEYAQSEISDVDAAIDEARPRRLEDRVKVIAPLEDPLADRVKVSELPSPSPSPPGPSPGP
jgi:hypothetical protein